MNSLTSKTLEFSNTRIRTAGTFERPLFCLKDICDSLGIKNPSAYTPHLKPHWKDDLISNDAIGRSQKFTFITEEGVYRVLVRTRKPAAEKFQDWLCEEVLPSIRKTGQYQVQTVNRQLEYETKKLDLEFCKLAAAEFSGCTRMKYLLKEKIASALSCGGESQLALPAPKNLTVTEILEQSGFDRNVIYKRRSVFGRLIAGIWRKQNDCPPPKIQKLVNGHDVAVNAYPTDFHETIRQRWLSFIAPPKVRQSPWQY